MIFLKSQRLRIHSAPLQPSQKKRTKALASFINSKQLRKSRGRWSRTMTPLSGRSKISWNHKQKSTWKNISSLQRHCYDILCSWTLSIPHAGGLFALLKGEYHNMTWFNPPVWMKNGQISFGSQFNFLFVCSWISWGLAPLLFDSSTGQTPHFLPYTVCVSLNLMVDFSISDP